jgi:chorismate mutase/prephenate dehydratase
LRKKHEDRRELAEVRDEIDRLDAQIQALISERARLAFKVRQSKGQSKSAVDFYRPEREAQVLRGVIERNQGPLRRRNCATEIMSACLAQQEPLKVAYLGPEGTFTNRPHRHFAIPCTPSPLHRQRVEQVQSGDADFGGPIENSTQGIVSHTLTCSCCRI